LPKSRQWQTIQRIESHTLVCMKVSGLGHDRVSITLSPHSGPHNPFGEELHQA
jgi:hypothetical protein